MPVLKILTNLTKDKIPSDLLPKLNALLAELLRKDKAKFSCVIAADCCLDMNGSAEAGVVGTLESIGHLGPDDNKRIVRGLADFVERELHVTPDRFLLTFYDLKAHNLGKFGTTADAW